MLKKYVQFINEEASPRLPKNEEYWLKKGKDGKKEVLYNGTIDCFKKIAE